MTTTATFNRLKKIDQRTKDIVFGYNHQKEKQYNKQIPQMINYLCLAYYYIYNKLDLSKINKKYVKLLNGNTLVWKKQDFELILPMNANHRQWIFQMNQLCPEMQRRIIIGIIQNHGEECRVCGTKLYKYGFNWSNGMKIKKYTCSKRRLAELFTTSTYAEKCSAGDIITMTLDEEGKQLKFKINDKDYGVAWATPREEYSILILGNKGLSITMIDV